MTHHVKRLGQRLGMRRLIVTSFILFIAAYLLLGYAGQTKKHIAEARFTDESPSGLALVPASGGTVTGSYEPATGSYEPATGSYTPATGSYTPETGSYTPATGSYTPGTGSYTASYTPGTGSYPPGTGSYTPGTSSYNPGTGSYTACWDGSTPGPGGSCPPCPEGYTQVGNSCVPPSGPQFEGFPTPYGFTASGHLEVRPSLVRSGDTTRVFWNVRNVRDCTVRGTNGDGAAGSLTGTWNMLNSGANGQVTSPITSRTDYTLFCRALIGASPTTITETRTVNVIPEWFEPSEGN